MKMWRSRSDVVARTLGCFDASPALSLRLQDTLYAPFCAGWFIRSTIPYRHSGAMRKEAISPGAKEPAVPLGLESLWRPARSHFRTLLGAPPFTDQLG
jgi:hypothetical protein